MQSYTLHTLPYPQTTNRQKKTRAELALLTGPHREKTGRQARTQAPSARVQRGRPAVERASWREVHTHPVQEEGATTADALPSLETRDPGTAAVSL